MDLSLIISITTSIVISFFFGRYYTLRKQKTNKQIQEIENSIEYLRKIRAKPTELIRHAFSRIFLILFLICIGLFLPVFFGFIMQNSQNAFFNSMGLWLQLIFLMLSLFASFYSFQIFNDVVNYDAAIKKHNEKINRLKKKIEHT
jgi:uncharacterized membrane protein YdjX (TVP38/TMEM64 family)